MVPINFFCTMDSKIQKFIYFDYNSESRDLENMDQKLVYVKDDKYYIPNVINKKVIPDEFYPILMPSGDDVRSLEFIKKYYQESNICLETEDRLYFTLALRDLFMYCVLEEFKNEEINEIVSDISIETQDDEISFIDEFFPISYFPSRSFQVVRYIEKTLLLDDPRFCLHNDKKVIFMRKYDLTYYNFENIITLDNDDLKLLKNYETNKDFDFAPNTNVKFEDEQDNTIIFTLNEDLGKYLLKLDEKKYYIKPFNDDQRGGLRFIFNSLNLSNYLTNVIKNLNCFKNFIKVNNVFRFNKFARNDNIFKNHFDISYSDKENKEYSLYTLIIYLKSDKNKVCLKLEGKEYKFDDFDCIIFNQNKMHEGCTFSEKIFIRTDLIFHVEDENLNFKSQELAKIFNQACYISLKSVFQPQLKKYSSELFHEFNVLKYKSLELRKKIDHYFSKTTDWYPVAFITNGYNYYFPYCGNISIKSYIIIILHDYFSSEYINEIEEDVESIDQIDNHLTHCRCQNVNGEVTKMEENGDYDYIFTNKTKNCSSLLKDLEERYPLTIDPYPYTLCGTCFDTNCFNPKIDERVLQCIDDNIINSTSCVVKNMFKLNNIKVVGNRVHFFTEKRVHFAGCVSGYYCSAQDFIEQREECGISNIKNNVFIDFTVENNIIIFSFDFFKNNVSYECKKETNLNFIGHYRNA